MTAIITSIKEYIQRKERQDRTEYFKGWSDHRLGTRHDLLRHIEGGQIELAYGEMSHLVFPNGFDPNAHPEDDIEVIEAEMKRRGVAAPSQ